MDKLMIPSSKKMILECLEFVDGMILGIQNLSVNLPFYIELEDLKKIKTDKKIFIMLNKNMHNKDLEPLKNALLELENYGIAGVFYYDASVVELKNKLNLSYPLIWSQEHLTTNAMTCNFWKNYQVSGAYLSSEITLEEIKEIRKNTEISLFINVFGYLPMFDSKRHLVKNYLEYFQFQHEGELYFLEKEGNRYPIIDDEQGTTVYSSYILNAIEEIPLFEKIGIDYVVFNSFLIDSNHFKSILEKIKTMTLNNQKEVIKNVNLLCKYNVDKGFLYKETVYKVKGEQK